MGWQVQSCLITPLGDGLLGERRRKISRGRRMQLSHKEAYKLLDDTMDGLYAKLLRYTVCTGAVVKEKFQRRDDYAGKE